MHVTQVTSLLMPQPPRAACLSQQSSQSGDLMNLCWRQLGQAWEGSRPPPYSSELSLNVKEIETMMGVCALPPVDAEDQAGGDIHVVQLRRPQCR